MSLREQLVVTIIMVVIFLAPSVASAQFVITNIGGNPGTAPGADDVITCTDFDRRLRFRLTASLASSDPSVSVVLPTGVNYVAGTARVEGSNLATTPTIGPNTGTTEDPIFAITGTFRAGDFVTISLDRVATCGAEPGGGKQDEVTVSPGIGGAVNSENYDILAANLSVVAGPPLATAVGETETVSGTIVNGGNGCVEEFEFTVLDAAGLMTTSIEVAGVTLTPVSTSGRQSVYEITGAVIGGDGCFDGGETLPFTRNVVITSCELDRDGYTVRYGCFGEVCQTSSFANQQFNIDFTVPRIRLTGGRVVQRTDLCRDAIVQHTFTNQGTGAALDIVYLAGFGASGLNLFGTTGFNRDIPVTGVAINGTPVPFVTSGPNAGLEVDLGALLTDPDVGGLADLDLDGGFDDLPAGASFTVTITHSVRPEDGCPANRSTGSYKVATTYEDQCKVPVGRFVQNAAGSFTDFTEDSRGSIIGPADIDDGETFEVEICGAQRFSGTFFDCPTNALSLVGNLPPGFNLNFATINGAPAPGAEFRNDSVFVATEFRTRTTFCYTLNLTFDCAVYLADPNRDLDFDFVLEYECDENAACGATREIFSCPAYSPNIHCGDCVIGGLTTQNTLAVRTTTGFANPLTLEEFADPADLTTIQLKRAMPCDTVCVLAEGVQVGGTSGPTWENAFFHLEYDPVSSNAASTLTYAGGTVTIIEAATGNRSECPLPAPVEETVNNSGADNDLHVMDFDLTACLDALPGGLLRAGDSVNVNLKIVVEKTPTLDNDVPTQLEDIKIFHYNLRDISVPPDAVADTLRCDFYGLELYLHEGTNGNGGGLTNRQVEGCDVFTGFKTFPFSGSEDWYPGEIRPNRQLDSVYIEFTSRDVLDVGSVELRAEGSEADGYGSLTYIPLRLGTPDRIVENDNLRRYVWFNDGTWPLGDMNGKFNSEGGYSFTADFFPSCESVDGTLEMGFYGEQYGYARDPDCFAPIVNRGRVTVNHNLPTTALSNRTGTVEASNDTVRWVVQVQNTTNVNGGYVFLGFEDEATPNIDVVGLRDVAADTIIPILNYVDGHYAVVNPSFPPQAALEYEVIGLLTGCGDDAVRTITGFSCDEPMADPSEYPCDFDEVLLDVTPLLSRVQIRLDQAQAPYDLCTTIQDTVVITSAERAFIDNPLLCIPLPRGLTENDNLVEVTYPRLTGPTETLAARISNDTLYVDLTQHSRIGSRGVAGTDDALTQEEREVATGLQWLTDCDFIGGSTYRPIIFADRPCGGPAIGNGSGTTSDNIDIRGTLPSSVTAFNPEFAPGLVEGCDDVSITIDKTISLGETDDRDTLFVGLPVGMAFTPGSYVCTTAAATDLADCPRLVRVDEDMNGAQTVVFKIEPGVVAPVTFQLDFMAATVPGGICNDEGEVTLQSTTSNDGIACPTDPNLVCNNFTVLTGQAVDTIRFLKPIVELSALQACTEGGAYRVDGVLSVDTLPIPAGESVTVEFFCPEAPATVLGSLVLDGPIAVATPVPFATLVPAGCGGVELTARVTPEGGVNCICATVESTFEVTPPVVVEAGPDATICSSADFPVSPVASVSGGVVEGSWSTSGDGEFVDAAGGEATLFSEVVAYSPGANDAGAGRVVLTLTSDASGACASVVDDLVLTILQVDCGEFFWGGVDD